MIAIFSSGIEGYNNTLGSADTGRINLSIYMYNIQYQKEIATCTCTFFTLLHPPKIDHSPTMSICIFEDLSPHGIAFIYV